MAVEDNTDTVSIGAGFGHSVRPSAFCAGANSCDAFPERSSSASRKAMIDEMARR